MPVVPYRLAGLAVALAIGMSLLAGGAPGKSPVEEGARLRAAGAIDEAVAVLAAGAASARKAHATEILGVVLPELGDAQLESGQTDAAIATFEEARAVMVDLSDRAADADLAGRLAGAYLALGRLGRASEWVARALEGHEKSANAVLLARDLRTRASLAAAQGDFLAARKDLERARNLDEGQSPSGLVADLSAMSALHEAWGQEERAGAFHLAAIEATKADTAGRPALAARALLDRARALVARERLDLAFPLFEAAAAAYVQADQPIRERLVRREQAMALQRSGKAMGADALLGDLVVAAGRGARQGEVAELQRLRGIVKTASGRHAEATAQTQAAVSLLRLLDRPERLAGALVGHGDAQAAAGQDVMAIEAYSEAIALFTDLDRRDRQADIEHAVGGVLLSGGKLQGALAAFDRAVSLDAEAGEVAEAARCERVGLSLVHRLAFKEAEGYLTRAVALRERARDRAKGAQRRDYLAAQIHSYNLLVATRLLQGDAPGALAAFEDSRARWLAEVLGRRAAAGRTALGAIQAALGPSEAALVYVDAPPLGQWVVVVRRGSVRFAVLPVAALDAGRPGRRGSADTALGRAIETLREAWQSPAPAGGNKAVTELSRKLYRALIGPASPHLGGAASLLVVPDGALSFLPFEGLQDERGKYLVERYALRYVQSLSVHAQLASRKAAAGRMPLLAFGSPVYESLSGTEATDVPPLDVVRRQAYDALERRVPLRGTYAALGVGDWSPLPGSKAETERIAAIVPGARRLLGKDVTEAGIKQASAAGELARYRMLHFATHGLAVPEVPELSALVLSQQRGGPAAEDGYLRVEEVSNLKLAADFVNLSACETALGKLLKGEGVVGLAQAFLAAGTKGISVSQWPISDEGTATFMEALYTDIAQGKTPVQAMRDVKRRFIGGEFGPDLEHPYFWAPFVYFGV